MRRSRTRRTAGLLCGLGLLVAVPAARAWDFVCFDIPSGMREAVWRDALAKHLGGQTELKIASGRVDVITSNTVVELDWPSNWKSGMGQVLVYAGETGRAPILALIAYGQGPDNLQAKSGLGIAQALGIAIPVAGYLAAALLVIGLTLVAATWLGMARGLLPLGILLAIAVLIITAAGPALRAPAAAASSYAYANVADLPAAGDSEDFGELSVDLSKLAMTSDATYSAHVDLGRLEITVPKDANVLINYTADLGEVRAYGVEVRAGSDLSGQITDPRPTQPPQHTLTLDLSVDAGNIEVQR